MSDYHAKRKRRRMRDPRFAFWYVIGRLAVLIRKK